MSKPSIVHSAENSLDTVLMAGYGTLLLRESLGDTVSQESAEEKELIPIVVKGCKRVYNLFPDHYPSENRLDRGPIERAAANTVFAEGYSFNAIAFKVKASELEMLDKRERYYKRVSAPCFEFSTGKPLGECYFYMSEPDARWIQNDITKLLPLWRDIVYARVGSYRISEDFGKLYDATSWMADGQTLVVDYYKDYLAALDDLDAIRNES
jgi:hypothetical protein